MLYRVDVIFSSFDDDYPERSFVTDFHVSSDDFASSFSFAVQNLVSISSEFLSVDYGVPFFVKDIKCSILESED